MDDKVFFYIDGDTCTGMWIDLEYVDSYNDIKEELAKAGYLQRDKDERPIYDGDLLVADIEGELANCFYQNYGLFDLDGFVKARDSSIEAKIAAAYIDVFDEFDEERCEALYQGEYESLAEFTEQYVEGCGFLSSVPEELRDYFDFERYGQMLMINDFNESSKHYFSNPSE